MRTIVEHVARALFKSRTGYDSDRAAVTDVNWPEGEEWRNQPWAHDEPAARAAIRATLEYARDNVSENVVAAGMHAIDSPFYDDIEKQFRAMLDALLAELDGPESEGRG